MSRGIGDASVPAAIGGKSTEADNGGVLPPVPLSPPQAPVLATAQTSRSESGWELGMRRTVDAASDYSHRAVLKSMRRTAGIEPH